MPNTLIKVLLTLAVLVTAVAAAASILMTRPQPERLQPAEAVSAIRAITVVEEPLTLTVQSEGTVVPKTTTELIPEVSGKIQWRSPNLVVGGYFKAGEPLLEIDASDYEAQAGLARARLIRAKADLEHSSYELKRLQTLVKGQLISQSNLENAVRAHKIAEATHLEATINLSLADRNLKRTVLTAPFEGLVRAENIDVGQFIREGVSVATLYSSDAVEIRLPIANHQLAFLDLPASARGELSIDIAPRIALYADYAGERFEWSGHLARTEAQIDPESRMVTAVARINQNQQLPGTPALQLGLFVVAVVEGKRYDKVVRLPRAALRNQNQVLIIDDQERLRYRTIDILRLEQETVIVQGGLEAGERVNISPIQTVVDGMRVAVSLTTPNQQG